MSTTLEVTDITTEDFTGGIGGSSDGRVSASAARTSVSSSTPTKFISFPKDLQERSDSSSESGFQLIPHIKLTIYEVKKDESGMPRVGQDAVEGRLTDPTGTSIAGGLEGVYKAATSSVGLGFIAAGTAAKLELGTTETLLTGGAVAAAQAAGGGKLADDAISSLLGLKGETIGETFKKRLQGFSVRRNIDQIQTQIVLPIPENIGVAYDQTYLEVGMSQALGLPGLLTQGFAARNSSPKQAMDPYGLELASSLAQNIPGVGSNADRIVFFGTSGLVVNPQLEMLFSGTALRRFVLDFKLTPKNRDDAERLFSTDFRQGIISALKYYSAPDIPNNTTGRYFVPPAQFEIEFFRGGNYANKSLFKTKKCVLTSVTVDYTPNGYITHDDGTPAQVSMQLNFVETSIISRNDYLNGIR